MKKWLFIGSLFGSALGSMIFLSACLEDPNNEKEATDFDATPSATHQSCDQCHLQMPPASAPHNDTHAFFACNDANCHGQLVNEDGSMASISDDAHTNNTMDATCLPCHAAGTVSPDTDGDSNFTCVACHENPPSGISHSETHASFSCNSPSCHGEMVNEEGTQILDQTKHMDNAAEARCANCHSDEASCIACHEQLPPSGSPHTDANHNIFRCNSPECHGAMINEDGTEILDDTKHMDGESEIPNLDCGAVSVCHGT